MSGNLHERARQLALAEKVEGIAAADAAWLAQHLGGCPDCAGWTQALNQGLRSLRSIPVSAPARLTRLTQARVRVRAAELRQERLRAAQLVIAGAVAAFWTVFSVIFFWSGAEWIASAAGLSTTAWQVIFLSLWVLPVLVSAMALLWFLPGRGLAERRAG